MTKTIAVIGSGMTGLVTALSLSKYEYEVTIFSSNIKGEASKAAAGILFPLYPWKNSENMVQLCLKGKVLFDNYLKKHISEKHIVIIQTRNIYKTILSLKDMLILENMSKNRITLKKYMILF